MSDLYVNTGYKETQLAPFGPIGIIAHTSNKEFVKQVSEVLSQKRKLHAQRPGNIYANNPGYAREDYIIDTQLTRFQTGEGKFGIAESVRGHDIFVITDVLARSFEYDILEGSHVISPDDQYMDLLRIISVLKGKAKRINVIMPFVYEGRREKLDSHRESYDCADMLKKLYKLGVSNLIIFDPHDARIENAVPLMSIEFPRCQFKITSSLLNRFGTIKMDKDHTLVVSPDETGISRAIFYSSHLNLPLGVFYRHRDYTVKVNGEHPIREFKFLGEDVEGKDILLIDDMINSGNTMLRTAKKLKDKGAKDIYCLAPFGLFTDGLEVFDKAYEEGGFNMVISTNATHEKPEVLSRPWYKSADLSKYIAIVIDHLNHDASINDLLNPTERIMTRINEYKENHTITDNYTRPGQQLSFL